ncbi:MAG: hypothetical protein K1X88_32840 [Nannocystaceae bacterium]|nr:hypothetical protein [Nannocystaceae bacterium]
MTFAPLLFAAPAKPPEVLPLRKLRLYETGVGYFERRGGVSPTSRLGLPLPAAHLDDALKTLVVLDHGGGAKVRGLEFASAVSESGARAMAGLPAVEEGELGYAAVLAALEGSAVEAVVGRTRVRGRLVRVEGPFSPPAPAEGDPPAPPREPWHALTILDDDGALHRVRTDELASLRAQDDGVRERLAVAAEALSDHSARAPHPLSVRVTSAGQLGLGYIAESPVWRTTYRVVLPAQGTEGRLQAWALVHNDTDEHWRGVSLELANGRPQSFLYPLAAPRYARRELAGPEDPLSTVPQLANTTADELYGDAFGVGGLGLSGVGYGGGGSGEGSIGLGRVGTIGHGAGSGAGAVAGEAIGDLAELSQAEGQESGSLFVYRVSEPLQLDAHHSALVPIVDAAVEAESITWFAAVGGEASTGARVLNSTTQTLPAGVVSFFGDGAFIGEAALQRLKPRERQFIAFGTEQDVELSREITPQTRSTGGVRMHEGNLVELLRVRSQHTLRLENRSGRDRRVYVGLDVPRNAKITAPEGVVLDFDDDSDTPLAIVSVPRTGEFQAVLEIETAESESAAPLDPVRLRRLARVTSLPEATRERLAKASAHAVALAAAEGTVAELTAALEQGDDELGRLRADLAAVGSARLRTRATKSIARELLTLERAQRERREAVRTAARERDQAREAAMAELARL